VLNKPPQDEKEMRGEELKENKNRKNDMNV
jgi:hypothetical protein